MKTLIHLLNAFTDKPPYINEKSFNPVRICYYYYFFLKKKELSLLETFPHKLYQRGKSPSKRPSSC